MSGNVTVNGNDANPSGWACTGTLKNMPGAVITPTATQTINGSVTIKGSPPYTTSSAAADTSTYFNYGGATYTSLAAAANIILPGGTYTGMSPNVAGGLLGLDGLLGGGTCQTSDPNNWGDPGRALTPGACESYFPIIHITGDAKLTNGSGQGILLVDGDLTKAGNFHFTGVVIARGTVKATGSNNGITGVVMAAAIDLGDAVLLGGSTTIQYSSCAVQQALSASSSLTTTKGRAWVNLY